MPRGSTCSPCKSGACPTEVTGAGIPQCEPMPFLLGRVDFLAERFRSGGVDDLDALTLAVLTEAYPTTRDGTAIDWASLSSSADASCLLELCRRVHVRVAFILASAREVSADARWASSGLEVLA